MPSAIAASGVSAALPFDGLVRTAPLLQPRALLPSLQRLVPEIQPGDLATGGSGVRAQAITPEGELVQDFQLIARPDALHVLNAPSPAATASLAIGAEIAATVKAAL
jgi:(S)-2-hydroxyglutarate dehydrogenase